MTEHKEEVTAKHAGMDFGGYPCPHCGKRADNGKWVSSRSLSGFIQLMDHIILDHLEADKQFQRAQVRAREHPFEDHQFARQRLERARLPRKPVASAKDFLPNVSDWLVAALKEVPRIDSISESSMLVADDLVDAVRNLGDSFLEQRHYLLQYETALRETAMDPKWPRKRGSQVRFVADSMAGIRWGYKPTSSREFIRIMHVRKGRTIRRSDIDDGN